MIITDDEVLLDLTIDDNIYLNLKLSDVEELLLSYKLSAKLLKPKESFSLNNIYMSFSDDSDKNKFFCRIYKTLEGTDRWILFMMDNIEGYALYMDPTTNKMVLSWYNSLLNEPLNEESERDMITCYVPKKSKVKTIIY
ncbi:hypothetical protein [Methanosphaera sp. WGK6]|uniref:hypothetical protein n=1 Tax=Methanosphaera sp. WGK6 TaxID=1561964 RepID=UPI00084BF9CF|nr:hypothetical protein [Methanosphaera sp. WGK6]OED29709.1 hypothetical protein NL43_06915 [Methanosphaera sp. WGK6]